MLAYNRLLLLVGLTAICLIFTLYSTVSHNRTNTDARLHVWTNHYLKASTAEDSNSPVRNVAPEPFVPFDPFPLKLDSLALPPPPRIFLSSSQAQFLGSAQVASTSNVASTTGLVPVLFGSHSESMSKTINAAPTKQPTSAGFFPFGIPSSSTSVKPRPTATFSDAVHDFQRPQAFTYPRTDLKLFKDYPAHNYVGKGNESTFAVYFCTRNSSMEDPYFAATLQLVWRMLWSDNSRSLKHPFTVFVAPFIAQEQRDMLAGAGALVRELDLLGWAPEVTVDARRRDAFSKINLWAQKDFAQIAALDSDAFPIRNIDSIFDEATPRICDLNKLATEDLAHSQKICDYTFAAVPVTSKKGALSTVNVGVMVLQPNEYMHQRLLRGYNHTESYDNRLAEQAFMNWAFAANGPFPVSFLPREYNGYFPQKQEMDTLKVIHEKLWVPDGMSKWTRDMWSQSWNEMIGFFDGRDFQLARGKDVEPLLEHHA